MSTPSEFCRLRRLGAEAVVQLHLRSQPPAEHFGSELEYENGLGAGLQAIATRQDIELGEQISRASQRLIELLAEIKDAADAAAKAIPAVAEATRRYERALLAAILTSPDFSAIDEATLQLQVATDRAQTLASTPSCANIRANLSPAAIQFLPRKNADALDLFALLLDPANAGRTQNEIAREFVGEKPNAAGKFPKAESLLATIRKANGRARKASGGQ